MRPGERLNEILFAQRGADRRDRHRRHHGGEAERAADADVAEDGSRRSKQAIARDDRATIRAVLKDAVPEFGPSGLNMRDRVPARMTLRNTIAPGREKRQRKATATAPVAIR